MHRDLPSSRWDRCRTNQIPRLKFRSTFGNVFLFTNFILALFAHSAGPSWQCTVARLVCTGLERRMVNGFEHRDMYLTRTNRFPSRAGLAAPALVPFAAAIAKEALVVEGYWTTVGPGTAGADTGAGCCCCCCPTIPAFPLPLEAATSCLLFTPSGSVTRFRFAGDDDDADGALEAGFTIKATAEWSGGGPGGGGGSIAAAGCKVDEVFGESPAGLDEKVVSISWGTACAGAEVEPAVGVTIVPC